MPYLRQAYLLFILTGPVALSQVQSSDPHVIDHKTLCVKVSNITKLQGQMMLAVYDNQKDFLSDNVVASAIVPVRSEEVFMALDSLALSRPYAISIYHDVNSNGKLDTNIMSIPVEPFGFSNNNLGLVPIPNYQKSAFVLDEKLDSLEIILR